MQNQPIEDATPARKRLSPVWLVPLTALIIAIALGVRAWQQKGEQVEIIFDAAGGIEVGKTEVRLKDVPVGKVTKLHLSEDLAQVHAIVTLDRSMSRHLSEHTRFWLVTPRISASGVSNLGTLVSGVYIVMDPGKKEGFKTHFVGLSEPPAVQSDEKGTQYILRADTLGSLDIGSPVYYRQLRVGEVINYQLSDNGNHVDARVFIEAPYDRLVSPRSRFWNVSGFDVSIGIDGVKAEMASLSSLLLGGVAFESPAIKPNQKPVAANHTFALFADKQAANEGLYTLSYPYSLRFSHSVKGLNVGAPVEYRGLKVGRVSDIQLASINAGSGNLEVVIRLEPQRFAPDAMPTKTQLDDILNQLIANGLRAEIKTANLVLGSKYIDLSYYPDGSENAAVTREAASAIAAQGELVYLPTLDEPLDQIERQIAAIADTISKLPLASIGKEVDQSVQALNEILSTLAKNKTAEALHGTLANTEKASQQFEGAIVDARQTLTQLTQTLKSVDHTIAPDSQLHAEFLEMLDSVSEASDSFDRFVEELYRYPSSLVFGLGKDQ